MLTITRDIGHRTDPAPPDWQDTLTPAPPARRPQDLLLGDEAPRQSARNDVDLVTP